MNEKPAEGRRGSPDDQASSEKEGKPQQRQSGQSGKADREHREPEQSVRGRAGGMGESAEAEPRERRGPASIPQKEQEATGESNGQISKFPF